LLGGLTFVFIFLYHGTLFLNLKLEGEILDKAKGTALKLWLPTVILFVLFYLYSFAETNLLQAGVLITWIVPVIALLLLIFSYFMLKGGKPGWAFIFMGLTIALTVVMVFGALYPNVLPSTLNPAWNLTIHNASSSPYTLKVMSIVALIFVPIVLVYQSWTYYVFRKRIGVKSKLEY